MILQVIDTINEHVFRLFFPLNFGYLSIKTLPMKSNLPDWDLISNILSIFVWIFQKSFRVIVISQTTYPLREILVKIYNAISCIMWQIFLGLMHLHVLCWNELIAASIIKVQIIIITHMSQITNIAPRYNFNGSKVAV